MIRRRGRQRRRAEHPQAADEGAVQGRTQVAAAPIGLEGDFLQSVAGGERIDSPAPPRIPVIEVTGDDGRAGVGHQQRAERAYLLKVSAAAQGEVDPVQADHQQVGVGQGKSGHGDGFGGAQPGLRIG